MSAAPVLTPETRHDKIRTSGDGGGGGGGVQGDNDNLQEPNCCCDDDEIEIQPQQRKVRGIKWGIVIVSLISSTFLYAFDNTAVANVRPSIVETFNRIDFLPWLSVSYPLGEVGGNPIWGKLNELFDNKVLYLVSLLVFEVGSAVIGSAQSSQSFVVGRALAGFGGSGIYVGTINIVSAITTPMERAHYLNLVGIAWSLGTILGPIIAGAFAESSATWRWAFYINIVVAALTGPLCFLLIPRVPTPSSSSSISKRLRRIDVVGAVLFLGGVVSTIMILGFGGALYSWTDPRMITLYVVAPALWLIFGLQQYFSFFTPEPIFHVQFVGSREMTILFVWTAISISNLVVTIYSLPLFYQFAHGQSPILSGAYTIPYVGAIIVSVSTSGLIFAKYPLYMAWFAGGSALMLIGNALLSTIDFSTSFGTISGWTIISGFGVGPVLQLGYTVAQVKLPPSDVRKASQFLSCAQMAGLALSLGIATSVFLSRASDDIAAILPGLPRREIMSAIDSANAALFEGVDNRTKTLIGEAISRNIGRVFYLNVAGAGVGFILSMMMRREMLDLSSKGT